MKLDIGCGQSKKPGFVGIDRAGDADLLHDLERFPWPLENESVAEVWCSHYVEHTRDLVGFMNECWRIMRPGAKMTVNAPYYTSIRAHSDPDHKRLITEGTFDYFSRVWRTGKKMDHTGISADFETAGRFLVYTPEWNGKPLEEIDHARKHFWNVVSDIQVILIRK